MEKDTACTCFPRNSDDTINETKSDIFFKGSGPVQLCDWFLRKQQASTLPILIFEISAFAEEQLDSIL